MSANDNLRRWPKAILFDLDDTIITFDAVADQAWTEVCRHCCPNGGGRPEPEALFQTIAAVRDRYWSDPARSRAGRFDLVATRRKIVAMAFEELGVDDAATARKVADAYSLRRNELIGPIPGAIETLAALQQSGVAMALITNGDADGQRRKIDRFGLAQFFQAILIEGEQGIGKPEAEIYRRALDAVGAGPGDAWFVGDNLEWDVAAPQQMGIFSIWNDYTGRGLPPSATAVPDRIVNSIEELVQDKRPKGMT